VITAGDITRALADLGVGPRDTLFVHSGLKGALRLAGSTREEKLATLAGGLRDSVPEGLLILPAFTYSFTGESEPFHLATSPSTVGVLSEYFRTLPGVRRTADPLFSCGVLGELPEPWAQRLMAVGDVDCFGERSIFAMLAELDAKILFIGVDFEFCTYVFHVEQVLRVPYRYFKDFHGTVVDGGAATPVTARYYVRDLESDVVNTFTPLARDLLADGAARGARLERGPELFVTSARAVSAGIERGMASNPDYLLRRGHPAAD
jgi:aminoglycoside 3-N-acetyltransferase